VGRLALAFSLLLIVAAGSALAEEKVKRGDEGGKLSDAAKETAKPSEQQRTLHVDGNTSCDCGSPISVWISGSGGSGVSSAPDEEAPGLAAHDILSMLHVGTVVEMGSLSRPDFAPATLYGLRLGISDHRRASFDLLFLGGSTPFMPGSDIASRFRQPGELALDGSFRYSLTDPHAPMGIAPLVGFRAGWFSWTYRNGIWLERDGDEYQVLDDGINTYSPYLGLAVTLLRTGPMEVGVTGVTGWRYYGSHTGSGLSNDLFGQDRFTELRLETRFGL
jgi:hypothetical protein